MMDCADRWCRQFRRRLSRRALLSTETVTSAAVIHVTRHLLGLFQGRPGARAFRRILTEGAVEPGAGLEVLDAALAALRSSRTRQPIPGPTGVVAAFEALTSSFENSSPRLQQ